MANDFEIEIEYKGKQLSFPAELISTGYTYKIQVDVFGKIVLFEPDEERNFRAVVFEAGMRNESGIDKDLLREIAHELEKLFSQ